MRTLRERLMDEAFPKVSELFWAAAKNGTPWRLLFDALGERSVLDKSRRVHLIYGEDKKLPDPPPQTEATCANVVEVLSSIRLRTVEEVADADVQLLSRDASLSGRVPRWAQQAMQAGNLMLFTMLKKKLVVETDKESYSPVGLPAMIETARDVLCGLAMDLLVSERVHWRVTGQDWISKDVSKALQRGIVAPVAGLSDDEAYLLRHGAGDVVVEVVHDLAPHWDLNSKGGIDLIALQEFVVVAETKVPAYKLKLRK